MRPPLFGLASELSYWKVARRLRKVISHQKESRMCMRSAISAGALSLLLGTVAPAFSQREKQEKDKGKPQQGQQQQHAKPRKGK